MSQPAPASAASVPPPPTARQLRLQLDPAAAERRQRVRWKTEAAQFYFGGCDRCHRQVDDRGRPLLVARQPRHRYRECFDCFSARVTPHRSRKRQTVAP